MKTKKPLRLLFISLLILCSIVSIGCGKEKSAMEKKVDRIKTEMNIGQVTSIMGTPTKVYTSANAKEAKISIEQNERWYVWNNDVFEITIIKFQNGIVKTVSYEKK